MKSLSNDNIGGLAMSALIARRSTLSLCAAAAFALCGGPLHAASSDFSKIANNGAVLAATAALGTGAAGWACTMDNVTGLTWEVKTTAATDLRYSGHSYKWYSTNGAENGGNFGQNAGGVGEANSCNATLPSGQCNTKRFAAAVNAAALCGYSDWRLPTMRELKTIVKDGASSPAIDTDYFPNTDALRFWSASTAVTMPTQAWVVSFNDGITNTYCKARHDHNARLVRGARLVDE